MMGTINRYLTEKKYGFILPDVGDIQVFFHQSVFDPGKDGPPPITGESVDYTLSGEDTRAVTVSRLIQPDHHTGTVKSYDPVKGYGFVITSHGQYYLHKSEVIGGMVPSVGSQVDFYTSGKSIPGKSPRACYIGVL